MNQQDRILYIKTNLKSPISFKDVFYYFPIVALSLTFIYLCFGILPSTFQNDLSLSTNFYLALLLAMILAFIILLTIQARKNRRFIEFELPGNFESSKNTIILAARKALKVANVSINEELGLIYIHTKRSTFSISTGEKVTVI
jgi:hypothetical protein